MQIEERRLRRGSPHTVQPDRALDAALQGCTVSEFIVDRSNVSEAGQLNGSQLRSDSMSEIALLVYY